MVSNVKREVPAKLLRRVEGTGDFQPRLDLVAERFMGVLKRPVPRSEMYRQCGLDQRGCKVVTKWCSEAPDDHPVGRGDVLELEGQRYPVCGAKTMPGCYLEIYIEES
ncbi:MAG: hypothetical protein JOZ41_00375 [Chloroflexi bacterium]|nr:hypothetical protein [Chloroflexota bacterium]